MDKYKRLNMSDRIVIEVELNANHSFSTIAEKLGRDKASIGREVKKYRVFSCGDNRVAVNTNDCEHYESCTRVHLCGNETCMMYCCNCGKGCHQFCDAYISAGCQVPKRPPYVCNACDNRRRCVENKYFYSSRRAQSAAEHTRSKSQEGPRLSKDELDRMDKTLTDKIKGQPVDHLLATYPEDIPVSKPTLYRYIEKGYMTITNLDLQRKVKYKVRRNKDEEAAPDQAYKQNRTYNDFLAYMKDKDESIVTEMDTVKGPKGTHKCLLTMILVRNSVMLLFLLPACRQSAVIDCWNYLEDGLGLEAFKRLFGTTLTDNGSEFKDVNHLENDLDDQNRADVFYCDPMCSWEKPHIEKNHEYIRYVVPKGNSFDGYTQDDITILMNNINSTRRKSLGDRSPYEVIPQEDKDMQALMKLMHMEEIPPKYVNLSPSLLDKKLGD